MDFLEIYWTDFYKTGHIKMLPKGSHRMVSNFTARSGKLSNVPNNTHIVNMGQQMLMMKMKEDWQKNFFDRDITEIDQFEQDMKDALMIDNYDTTHFKELHKLGYLPLEVQSIEEGELIPYKVPSFVIFNTIPLKETVFDWLVNYLETILSSESWQTPTSATLAFAYRRLGYKWITKTDKQNLWFLDYQFHDFSMRGMGGKNAIINSGLGFASCSRGSDTLPVIPAARKYYGETKVVINSVMATEHAIMCGLTGFFLYSKENGTWDKIGELEVETYRYLLKKFPTGILSIVSDTWNLWRVLCEYNVILKEEILARDGKVVFRPDSGNPVDIICGLDIKNYINLEDAKEDFEDILRSNTVHGEQEFTIDNNILVCVNDKYYNLTESTEWNRYDKQYYFIEYMKIYAEEVESKPEFKGVVQILWETFGGDMSEEGYMRLNSKVGCIYGDSITYDRAKQIFDRLSKKQFASTNIVLGVGSYSLQYVTRDTHGFAQKATYVEITLQDKDGKDYIQGIDIFKDPITDDGTKKSARGLITVLKNENGEYYVKDQATWEDVYDESNQLKTLFKDGELIRTITLTEIRTKLWTKVEKMDLVA